MWRHIQKHHSVASKNQPIIELPMSRADLNCKKDNNDKLYLPLCVAKKGPKEHYCQDKKTVIDNAFKWNGQNEGLWLKRSNKKCWSRFLIVFNRVENLSITIKTATAKQKCINMGQLSEVIPKLEKGGHFLWAQVGAWNVQKSVPQWTQWKTNSTKIMCTSV